MWGAGPPATWAFAIFLASDMLFLRLFPGGFGVFAFSQCDHSMSLPLQEKSLLRMPDLLEFIDADAL